MLSEIRDDFEKYNVNTFIIKASHKESDLIIDELGY